MCAWEEKGGLVISGTILLFNWEKFGFPVAWVCEGHVLKVLLGMEVAEKFDASVISGEVPLKLLLVIFGGAWCER